MICESLEARLALVAAYAFNDYIPIQPTPAEYSASDFLATIKAGGLSAEPDAHDIWSGSKKAVVAVFDTGLDYTHPELARNIYIHQKEIPADLWTGTSQVYPLDDVERDGLITFWDLNDPANWKPGDPMSVVRDNNGNGFIDGGDLLSDSRWANNQDEDGNGHYDDLIGWDFDLEAGDNDPEPFTAHGTEVAGVIAATEGVIGGAADPGVIGVAPRVLILPIRIAGPGAQTGDRSVDDAWYAALDYLRLLRKDGGAKIAAVNVSFHIKPFGFETGFTYEQANDRVAQLV